MKADNEEIDSGVEILNPESASPTEKKDGTITPKTTATTDEEEDDDSLDETLTERLWGLTEMFPDCVRNGVYTVTSGSLCGVKCLYRFSCSVFWIFFSSSAILLAPVIFEVERMQVDEMQKQQQRQILLGPSAALSGGAPHGMGPSVSLTPPPPPLAQPSGQR